MLAGQRDPMQLAQLCHGGVKSSKDTIAKALEGDYRSEHIFALKQSLQIYRFYLEMVAGVDSEIRQHLGELPTATGAAAVPPKRTKSRVYQRQHFEPASFDLRSELSRFRCRSDGCARHQRRDGSYGPQ
jgi:hypothetical protein